jgi:hypothetical protein
MTKSKSSITPGVMRVILASLAIFCLLGVGFISVTAGNSSGKEPAGYALTSTPNAFLSGTPTATAAAKEPDVTLGLVLAGVLLMVVILFGTLHATRGLRTPPRSQK